MSLNWVTLIFGLLVLAFVVTHQEQWANRSMRGTAWKPSRRVWVAVVGGGALLAIVGSLINLFSE